MDALWATDVKKRNPVAGKPNRWLYECAMNLLERLVGVEADEMVGAPWCSENGMVRFVP